MTPTYEELLAGATTWRKAHKGVSIILSHHGWRVPDPSCSISLMAEGHPGTWAYYLLIPEQMYPHRWADFATTRNDHGFGEHGPAFNAIDFEGGITWASSEPYFDRKLGRNFDAAKVGCDYNHLWHGENGYPDTYESVTRDAQRTADQLLDRHPDFHLRCSYTGVWDTPENTYTAHNGATCHHSVLDLKGLSHHWMPADGDERQE